jgi:hypothetical protein
MKILIPALLASLTGITALAATARAGSCNSLGTTAWTSLAQCPAPNQNRGSSQGSGVLGFATRKLTVQLSVAAGNVKAQAQGINQLGKNIAACSITATPGQFNTTASGVCQGGDRHVVAMVFN